MTYVHEIKSCTILNISRWGGDGETSQLSPQTFKLSSACSPPPPPTHPNVACCVPGPPDLVLASQAVPSPELPPKQNSYVEHCKGKSSILYTYARINSVYTMQLMLDCKNFVCLTLPPHKRKSLNYTSLGYEALGSFGKWTVNISVLVCNLGVCAGYLIFISSNLQVSSCVICT